MATICFLAGSTSSAFAEPSRYEQAVLSDGPIGYWRFEETAGTVARDSADSMAAAGAQSGELQNVTLQQPSATPDLGAAARFAPRAGVKSIVDLGDGSELLLRGDLTLEWWQKTDRLDGNRAVIAWSTRGETPETNAIYEGILRGTGDKKRPQAFVAGGHEYAAGKNEVLRSATAIYPGKWYHVAIVRDVARGELQFYVNGFPSGEPKKFAEPPEGGEAGRATIGDIDALNGYAFDGLLDEVAIYPRKLAAEQILGHFRAALASADALAATEIVGHRGDARHAPENTLASIRGAIDAGSQTVEIDLNLTRDGVPILLHDDTLDRTTSGRGKVADHTWDQLAGLDAGAWKADEYREEKIPTFAQAIDAAGDRAVLMLDLKRGGLGEPLSRAIAASGAPYERFLFGPWDDAGAADVLKFNPRATVIRIGSQPETFDAAWFAEMKRQGYRGVSLDWRTLTQDFVDAARAHDFWVYTWTVNSRSDLSGALLMGLRGVITDDPAELRRVKKALAAPASAAP